MTRRLRQTPLNEKNGALAKEEEEEKGQHAKLCAEAGPQNGELDRNKVVPLVLPAGIIIISRKRQRQSPWFRKWTSLGAMTSFRPLPPSVAWSLGKHYRAMPGRTAEDRTLQWRRESFHILGNFPSFLLPFPTIWFTARGKTNERARTPSTHLAAI